RSRCASSPRRRSALASSSSTATSSATAPAGKACATAWAETTAGRATCGPMPSCSRAAADEPAGRAAYTLIMQGRGSRRRAREGRNHAVTRFTLLTIRAPCVLPRARRTALELGDAREEEIAGDADQDQIAQHHQAPEEIVPDDLAFVTHEARGRNS